MTRGSWLRLSLLAAVGAALLPVGLWLLLRTNPGCGSALVQRSTNGIGDDFCQQAWSDDGRHGWELVVGGLLLVVLALVRGAYLRRAIFR